METIANKWRQVKQRIREAEQAAGRDKGDVLLLAVSKTKPTSDIVALYRLGQRHFAESYVQEAVLKQSALAAFDISWHFIGPIQSNKTKVIARHFSWVHSVDRLKIARRLSDQRPDTLPPLNICLQVNISGEASKSGISLGDLPELIDAVRSLPRLRLRGVMAIPEPEQDFQKQRQPFAQLHQAVNALSGTPLDTFSMGMSADLEAAIAEGATIVRVGTGLFGPRQYP
ncbi:YggS family pyridoxal phosphate-dependent enzyme [methane-oxidizing endosymbiont of Gigantopelta aegis]|uniref:YggS family pyridoxal phosphate-dependent enzyme n=1 Tax=methane-oxidizing endosymbiont of Gigantopelta aegis TaxID=2794938 RepID=UPI0018DEA036|nr:YggS family pyridoxal phosphate-dependent enzyme [methane-oxidizing endosymbiont of Gigantopelta aegis]